MSSALFLATARVVFAHLADEQADGHVVNVAGRQRMLTQRMAREALAIALGDETARTRLLDAASDFERGLVDLVRGAPGRGLPQSPAVARDRLRAVEDRWPAFVAAVNALGEAPAGTPAFAQALAYIVREADGLLHDTDRVVAHFDEAFSGKVRRLRGRMTVLGIGGAAAIGATTFALLAGARRRAERAEAAVRRKEHELAELAEERRDLVRRLLTASEDERRRVAADIHDGPTQQLTGAAMLLEAALQGDEGWRDARARVGTALGYLEAALEETRRIITDIRPPLLDDLGVAEALRRTLLPTARDFEVALTIDAAPFACRPAPPVELVLYRVAHEATMNALKHASTMAIRVGIAERGGGLQLEVSDDGTGFDPATVAARSGRRPLGLLGMRERVELLDGRFAIRSAPGHGTTVTAWLPSAAADAGGANDDADR